MDPKSINTTIDNAAEKAKELTAKATAKVGEVAGKASDAVAGARGHVEAAVAEPGEGDEGRAQVAGADDDALPLVLEAEVVADLGEQLLHVVAESPGAVGAEVGAALA